MKSELSRRDQFAMAAMQGLLAFPEDAPIEEIIGLSVTYSDALIAELDRTAPKEVGPTPDADGWIPHKPGDPMPNTGDARIKVKFDDGGGEFAGTASFWRNEFETTDGLKPGYQIIAWKPD